VLNNTVNDNPIIGILLEVHGGNVIIRDTDINKANIGVDIRNSEGITISRCNFNKILDTSTTGQAFPNNLQSAAIRVGATLNYNKAVAITISGNYFEENTRELIVRETSGVVFSGNFITQYPSHDNNEVEDGQVVIAGLGKNFTMIGNVIKHAFNKQYFIYNMNKNQDVISINNNYQHNIGTNVHLGGGRFKGVISHKNDLLDITDSIGTTAEVLDNGSTYINNNNFRSNVVGWAGYGNHIFNSGKMKMTNNSGVDYSNAFTYISVPSGDFILEFEIDIGTTAAIDIYVSIYNEPTTTWILQNYHPTTSGVYSIPFTAPSSDKIRVLFGFDKVDGDATTFTISKANVIKNKQIGYGQPVTNINGKLLPTTDPLIDGHIWNNLGVVTISAG